MEGRLIVGRRWNDLNEVDSNIEDASEDSVPTSIQILDGFFTIVNLAYYLSHIMFETLLVIYQNQVDEISFSSQPAIYRIRENKTQVLAVIETNKWLKRI